jgi:5-methylcytosine-specific restriction enzyme subunit McrC
LDEHYRTQVRLSRPNFGDEYILTPQGYVGTLPLTPDFQLNIEPKVPIGNLFGMLAYAYQLDIYILEGLTQCKDLPAFYDRLAFTLANRVLLRCRRGLYHEYVAEESVGAVVRGRLDVRRAVSRPWAHELRSTTEIHTADVAHNQVLLYVLWLLARSGQAEPKTLALVTQAYRELGTGVSLVAFGADECRHFLNENVYTRLNQDYAPLHALCRFYLEHAAPSHEYGDHTMFPFLVDMNRLFELFVTEWLRVHLPSPYRLVAQESVTHGADKQVHFKIDLVIYEGDVPRFVLDTKYKNAGIPAQSDIQQIMAYAQVKNTPEAVLIYPMPLDGWEDVLVNRLRVRAVCFDLRGDLDVAGGRFLAGLFG